MPFNYDPGVTSTVGQTWQRSNELLGQVLMSVLTSMGERRDRQEQQAKTESQQGKAADAWMKSLGDNGEKVTGIPASAWDNLSARDKYASMTGVIEGQATRKVLQQQAEDQRKQQIGAALAKVLASAGGENGAAPTPDMNNPMMTAGMATGSPLLKAVGTAMASAGGRGSASPLPANGGGFTIGSLLQGLKQNPLAAESPQFMQLLGQMSAQKSRAEIASDTAAARMDVEKERQTNINQRAADRNAAQSDWREQEKAGKSLGAILSEKRSVLNAYLANPGTAGKNRDEQQQTFADLRGQIADIEDEMMGRKAGGKASAKDEKTDTKTPDAPADPAKRTKGTVYQTPKGLYEWTGSGWKPAGD